LPTKLQLFEGEPSQKCFGYFDKDASGTISLEELKQCLQSEDFTLPEDAISNLLKEVDVNNDNYVRTYLLGLITLID